MMNLPLGPEPKKVPGRETRPVQDRASNHLTPSQQLLRFFSYAHLPAPLLGISRMCHQLANEMELTLTDGPEKTMGLRKLLEAKDCFVRAALPKDGYPLIPKDSQVEFETNPVTLRDTDWTRNAPLKEG